MAFFHINQCSKVVQLFYVRYKKARQNLVLKMPSPHFILPPPEPYHLIDLFERGKAEKMYVSIKGDVCLLFYERGETNFTPLIDRFQYELNGVILPARKKKKKKLTDFKQFHCFQRIFTISEININ